MLEKQSVYIVIVTYNSMQWIDRCLKSTSGYPVIVVDNNSTDETISHLASNFPSITVLKQSENLGFGKANNVGIRHAMDQNCKAVFLLNQDAYLGANALKTLSQSASTHPDFGILSPIHINGKGDNLDVAFAGYMNYTENSQFHSDSFFNKNKGIYEVPFVNAAGWYLPLITLEKVGGFDPLFFHYGEDDNYCQRVRYHELKIGVVAECILRHDREDRKSELIVEYSSRHWRRLRTSFFVCYADVNERHNYKRVLLNQILAIIRRFCKLEWTHFKKSIRLLFLKKQWIDDAEKSILKNRLSGSNYL